MQQGLLEVSYVPSNEQIADVMTKPLSIPQFTYFRTKLNVVPTPLSLAGGCVGFRSCYSHFQLLRAPHGLVKRRG